MKIIRFNHDGYFECLFVIDECVMHKEDTLIALGTSDAFCLEQAHHVYSGHISHIRQFGYFVLYNTSLAMEIR